MSLLQQQPSKAGLREQDALRQHLWAAFPLDNFKELARLLYDEGCVCMSTLVYRCSDYPTK